MQGAQLTVFVSTVLALVVTTILVAVRCAVRLSIRGVGFDDWYMLLGQLLFIATCGCVIWGAIQGIGVHDKYLGPSQQVNAKHSVMMFQLTFLPAIFFVKASICSALLRITTSKKMKRFLCFIVFISFSGSFITCVGILALCQPISATWTGIGKCKSKELFVGVASWLTASSVITDLACSICPLLILRSLQMKRTLKIQIAAILSLGFLASGATIVRASYFSHFLYVNDYVWGWADLMTWSIYEGFIAIVVGSIPSLKPLFKGMKMFRGSASTSKRGGTNSKASSAMESGVRLDSVKPKSKSHVTSTVAPCADESESVKGMLNDEPTGIVVSSEYNVEHDQEQERDSYNLY